MKNKLVENNQLHYLNHLYNQVQQKLFANLEDIGIKELKESSIIRGIIGLEGLQCLIAHFEGHEEYEVCGYLKHLYDHWELAESQTRQAQTTTFERS